MIHFDKSNLTIKLSLDKEKVVSLNNKLGKYCVYILYTLLITISEAYFIYFYQNGLGLAYNDARSHLDIGRRIVEGLKPGLAQIGSVWLPLNHLLMVPTIWNDFMWHSGLAGTIQSMIAYIGTSLLIFGILKKIGTGNLGAVVGALVFALNLNILYLQSTAMTELLLIFTMTAGVYELIAWAKNEKILHLIKSAFWIMLSTLVRYDGWFLLIFSAFVIIFITWRKRGYKVTEGLIILFLTLASFGVTLWFAWNQVIFKDALYFAFGPFSAHVQQEQMRQAGVLQTQGNMLLSLKVFFYSIFYNTYTLPAIIGFIGAIVLWFDKSISLSIRICTSILFVPFLFNVLALYFGFSVIFVQGISGDTWFNIRYGIMLMPTFAVFIGYLIDRAHSFRLFLIGLLIFILFFAFANNDAVTLDDARVGSSQKNVSEVSGWLKQNAQNQKGFILISAASHDAIIFSSGLPMKRFIHEGTGTYWENATSMPDQWARWIVMRTYDNNDLTYKAVSKTPGFTRYHLVVKYPFADVYEIYPEYIKYLQTEPVLPLRK